MGKVRDLFGESFGRLTVIGGHEVREDRYAWWPCRCACGRKLPVRGTRLTSGRQVSCGCARADPDVRRAARWAVSPKRRQAIASLGALATNRIRGAKRKSSGRRSSR
jgi:hypothetical protein